MSSSAHLIPFNCLVEQLQGFITGQVLGAAMNREGGDEGVAQLGGGAEQEVLYEGECISGELWCRGVCSCTRRPDHMGGVVLTQTGLQKVITTLKHHVTCYALPYIHTYTLSVTCILYIIYIYIYATRYLSYALMHVTLGQDTHVHTPHSYTVFSLLFRFFFKFVDALHDIVWVCFFFVSRKNVYIVVIRLAANSG